MSDGYAVKKSDGRSGWQWTCPKGFNHYNFPDEQSARQDMETLRALKGER
ncbi:hypothetical protein [Paracoccus sp. (in: a-proteobacteria)]|nr:hypothetical protein [Paracoccus sp. (in: a-proteobacteria)]